MVTAATNLEISVDYQPMVGNYRVDVNSQILDYTTLRVERLQLNKNQTPHAVTRKLTGDRKAPVEAYTRSEPVALAANLYPTQPFHKNVSWTDKENRRILQLTPRRTNT